MSGTKKILLLTALALALRLTGIHFGLPATLEPDEPHHINVAVYFGSGDLNPHVFKHPTLWMYLLFALYGLYFIAWSGFGLLKNAADFALLFIEDPSGFYLIARAASALAGSLALWPAYLAGKRLGGERTGILAAGFLAVAPDLVYQGHIAKPDSLMFLWAACLWYFCARLMTGKRKWKDYLSAGAFYGLGCTTQYTAGLLDPLIFLGHWFGSRAAGRKISAILLDKKMWGAYAFAVAVFFMGTPFALVEPGNFWRDIQDILSNQGGTATGRVDRAGWCIASNFLATLGWPEGLGILLASAGAYLWWRHNRRNALYLALPAVLGGVFLSAQSVSACAPRYSASLIPGFILMASGTALAPALNRMKKGTLAALLIAALIPGFYRSLKLLPPFFAPDTRNLCTQWARQNVPEGSVVLMDQVHTSPRLGMVREQIEELLQKTSAIGHPRAKYYGYMLKGHKGGGWRVLRLYRTSAELDSMERHVEWSRQGYDLLDVEKGLPALKKRGVQFVVLSSGGATPLNSPRLAKFFWDVENKTRLVQEFIPTGRMTGPTLRVYQLP